MAFSRTLTSSITTAYDVLSSTTVVALISGTCWSFHPCTGRDTCTRDKTQAASLDDSMHRFPQYTTRLPLTKESFQVQYEAGLQLPHSIHTSHLHHHEQDHLPHDHVEELGRVDCPRGNSFLFTFHLPTAQSIHTLESDFLGCLPPQIWATRFFTT